MLDTDAVGADDDFFALGGDSILAVRVTSRLRAFGQDVSPRLLFTHPTLSALAAALGERWPTGAPEPTSFRPRTPALRLRCRTPSSACGSSTAFAPGSTEYTTLSVLRLRGWLDEAALRAALDGLVARHESLRTTFAEQDGRARQVVHPPYAVELPLDVLSGADRDAQLDAVLDRAAETPFDLSTGPLLRARLARPADDEHVLVLAVHHIVTDGWSGAVLGRDLSELYAAALEGRAPELPTARAVHRLRAWQRARTDVADEQLAYWREALDGLEPLELPTDRPRPAVRTRDGALVTSTCPPSSPSGSVPRPEAPTPPST
ncbi:peptide synthetase [Streptomyces alboflavus]|uniref:Peptide synthetase n=1 Tax=Streptomyces alboflavus TaxID=67267 RepID=A0A1Z1WSN3_9ACTN|nr:peptide synthetase [Streptomyces alboflavus]